MNIYSNYTLCGFRVEVTSEINTNAQSTKNGLNLFEIPNKSVVSTVESHITINNHVNESDKTDTNAREISSNLPVLITEPNIPMTGKETNASNDWIATNRFVFELTQFHRTFDHILIF